jgi:hypothetical protein
MAATAQQIPSATTTRSSSGISRPTCLGDGQTLTVSSDRHHERKTTKTKRNELKLVLNLEKDEKEEKMVKQLLTEGSEATDITLSSLPVTAIGSVSTAAEGSDNIVVARPDVHHQLLNQKHQPPIRFCRAEGEGRSYGVLRNHLQREAVIKAWHDEQSKVTRSIM